MEKGFLALDTVVTCVFNYPQCFDAEEYAHLYTPLRRERIARASLASVKMQSAAAELAYLAARKLAGIGDGSACYSYAENGRPVISGGFISMTHTEGCGAAAVSSVPVGVDAEKLRDLDLRIAQRMLIKDELAVLDRADDKPGTLLSYWTAKEACAKLSGEGIPALSRLSYDRGQGSVYDAAGGKLIPSINAGWRFQIRSGRCSLRSAQREARRISWRFSTTRKRSRHTSRHTVTAETHDRQISTPSGRYPKVIFLFYGVSNPFLLANNCFLDYNERWTNKKPMEASK